MTECLICFDDLDVYKHHVKCLNCKQLFHNICYHRWHNLQNQLFSKCVHCQTVGLQCSYIKIRKPTIQQRFIRWWLGI
jgi:hypothetical protein